MNMNKETHTPHTRTHTIQNTIISINEFLYFYSIPRISSHGA